MKKLMLGSSLLMLIVLLMGVFRYHQDSTVLLLPRGEQYLMESKSNQADQVQQSPPIPVDQAKISYSLQNDELQITFDQGQHWQQVPIEKDALFTGEYTGNEQTLIPGSYYLSDAIVAFIYAIDGGQGSQQVSLKYSLNQGKTWEDSVIAEAFPIMRFRKVSFVNEQFGYVILTGDRTMSQEYSIAYVTYDGGTTWQATNDTGNTRLLADGGFVDETTGFMSYGIINPESPDLYVTQDGGDTWTKATINIPEKYTPIFVQAELPETVDDHLIMLINQGPSGDYQGGKVKGEFISMDQGLTWEFVRGVPVDESD